MIATLDDKQQPPAPLELQFHLMKQSALHFAEGIRRIASRRSKSRVWSFSAPGTDGQAARLTFKIVHA